MRKISLLFALLVLTVGVAHASVLLSTVGVFSDPNDIFLQTFTYNPATMGGILNIQTWGYGGSSGAPGGTNLAGLTIPGGGFDPQVWLFSGTGASATLVGFDDDGSCPPGTRSPNCWDSTLTFNNLSAGTYTLALTAFNNDLTATTLGTTLGSGWNNGGSFNGRTNSYAVDVVATPEPVTFVLVGAGLLGLGVIRRRRMQR